MPEETPPAIITPTDKAATLKALLTKIEPKMELIAPKGFDAQRLSAIMNELLLANPELLACAETPAGRNSFARACMQIASLDLDPSKTKKECYVLPFKTSTKIKKGSGDEWLKYTAAVVVLDARGMVKLMRRAGKFRGITYGPVYKSDEFYIQKEPELIVKWVPDLDRQPKDRFWPSEEGDTDCELHQIRGFYCKLEIDGEVPQVGWMPLGEMLKRKAQSRASSSGPWMDWFIKMGDKTLIKDTCRHAPLSAEAMQALALDDEIETGERPALPKRSADGKPVDLSDVIEYEEGGSDALPEPEKPATKTDAVKSRLANKPVAPTPPAPVTHGETPIGGKAPEDDDDPYAGEEEEKGPQNGVSTQRPPVVEQEPPPPPEEPEAPVPPQSATPAPTAVPPVSEDKKRKMEQVCSDFNVGRLYTDRILALDPPSHVALMQVLNVLQESYGGDVRDGLAVAWEGGALKTWAAFKAFGEHGVIQESVAAAQEAPADDEYNPLEDEEDAEPEQDPSAAYQELAIRYSLTPKTRDWMLEHATSPREADAYFAYIKEVKGASINGTLSMHKEAARDWKEATANDGFEYNEGAE